MGSAKSSRKNQGCQTRLSDRFTQQTSQLQNYVLDDCIVCVVTNDDNMPTGSSSRMEASTSFSLLSSGSSIVLDTTTGQGKLGGSEVKGLSVRKIKSQADENVDQLKTMDVAKTSKTDDVA